MDNMRSSVSMRVRVCACVCVCVRERVRGGRRPTKARKVFCPPRTTVSVCGPITVSLTVSVTVSPKMKESARTKALCDNIHMTLTLHVLIFGRYYIYLHTA